MGNRYGSSKGEGSSMGLGSDNEDMAGPLTDANAD